MPTSSSSNLRSQLQTLYNDNGFLTPPIVVEAARPKDSLLHSRFEWDNRVAGEKYREQQASELIRSVKISYRKGNKTEDIRYFVSVQREDGYSYHPAEVVAQDSTLTAIVLRDMEREWRQLESKYGHFKEFIEMVRRDLQAAEGRREQARERRNAAKVEKETQPTV